jgi:hypothetical protein
MGEEIEYTAGKRCFVQGPTPGQMVSYHSSYSDHSTERNLLDHESLSWHVNRHKHGQCHYYHDANGPRHSARLLHLSSVSFLFPHQHAMYAGAAQHPHGNRSTRSLSSSYALHGRTGFWICHLDLLDNCISWNLPSRLLWCSLLSTRERNKAWRRIHGTDKHVPLQIVVKGYSYWTENMVRHTNLRDSSINQISRQYFT